MNASDHTPSSATNTGTLVGIPELPEVRQHLARPTDPVVGTVIESRICTLSKKASGFVRHIEIDVSGTTLEGSWVAGQSFGVVPPGTTESGKPHKLRLYSIAAPSGGETGDGTIISTTLKRVVDEHWETHNLFTGLCSNYLADLQVGEKVHLTGPAGKRFLLPSDPASHNYVFIATGTGIAPFRSMLGDLVNAGMPSRVDLIMGAPYESDLLYHTDLTNLAEQHPTKFFYRTAISRHTSLTQPTKLYVQGRLENDSAEITEVLNDSKTLVYICGIAGMELGIFRAMAGLLDPESLAQYLTIHPDIGTDPDGWDRKMIPRKLKPTKRMFLEVY